MEEKKHIMIICGEASGDLHAANLVKRISEISPDTRVCGVGGALMRQAGAEIYCDIKDLAVIGLFDVLKKLPKFLSLKKLILEKISKEKPNAIILVDFSGFNLRLAKAINKSVPIIYYISPQVWASRPGRIKTIKEHIAKIVVLFQFEEEFYKRHGINAIFVGHPLLDIVHPATEKKEFLKKFGLLESKMTIALLPGSRSAEIKHILPIMLRASVHIHKEIKDAQFVVAKSNQVNWDVYNRCKRNAGLPKNFDLKIIEGRPYDCLEAADFCLVASGTATLEAAIMQKPFVIIYKMNLLNYFLYRPQIKLPYIGMVNIVAQKKIIPEFIQFQANPKKISGAVTGIIKNPGETERIKNDLAAVKSSLGEKGASLRAAQIIVDFLSQRRS